MIVDQINSSVTGGAAVATLRLHEALLAMGVESRLWHSPAHDSPSWSHTKPLNLSPRPRGVVRPIVEYASGVKRRLQMKWEKWRYLTGRSPDFEFFSFPRTWHDTPFEPTNLSGDVLHLHWITKLLDFPSFFPSVPTNRPLIWTLHDMNAFTGGCHHADGCERFVTNCQQCPQLARRDNNDLAVRTFQTKLAALRGKALHIVTPSRWLEGLARRSRILAEAASFQTIYNGLDTKAFQPLPKNEAKRKLGLPTDSFVVGFGAASLENRRKGCADYLEALARMSEQRNTTGLMFGAGQIPTISKALPEVRQLGLVSDVQDQVAAYSAMDVFVLPSWAENLAQTGVEALACETPVVAFDVGGLPEYVRPGETGFLAPLADATELARHLEWLRTHRAERQQFGKNGRTLVEKEFNHTIQAGKYRDLYQQVLLQSKARPQSAAA